MKRKYFDRSEYTRLNGANIIARTMGTCVVTCPSGCGTIRGAGSTRSRRLLDVDDRGDDVKPFMSVSCRRMSCGADCVAAAAMGSIAGSPSKKRAMAICTFHSQRRRSGTAAARSWSVTAVNCWRADCWSAVRLAMSASGCAMVGGLLSSFACAWWYSYD